MAVLEALTMQQNMIHKSPYSPRITGLLTRLLPLAAAPLLTGCYETFYPDIDTTPVLCLSALVTDGEPIEASLTRSTLYTDGNNSDNRVPDGIVTLLVNGQEAPDGYLPRQGDHLKFTATSPVYGRVEAVVTVPEAVAPDAVRYHVSDVARVTYEETCEEALRFNLVVNLEIADPHPVENYYRIDWRPEGESFYCSGIDYDAEPIFAEHIGVLDSMTGSVTGGFAFFTDRQLAGRRYTLNLRFNDCLCDLSPEGDVGECGLRVILGSVSASYYYLANYIWQTSEGVFYDLGEVGLGDPQGGYSNVSGGAGVVAAQSQTSVAIDLAQELSAALRQLP